LWTVKRNRIKPVSAKKQKRATNRQRTRPVNLPSYFTVVRTGPRVSTLTRSTRGRPWPPLASVSNRFEDPGSSTSVSAATTRSRCGPVRLRWKLAAPVVTTTQSGASSTEMPACRLPLGLEGSAVSR
jgi:hypothetical protein